ncbi:protein kinase [Spiractinospora alimapuensis]|uniref:serine/threonine-protein kinase n=1 Tax=Spiractinospora alimapuensis TaxID=2820884 RepID=UPI001F200E6D|nr:serine/threonine-protein kinase [Spiractinospora alimapuensis]QVQ51392.1 protein kinase [Spiractinospora alimapuensis]
MASDGLPKNLESLAAGDPAAIGPYVLAGRLGSGGMGTVYLGRSSERESLVAIKVIRPELAFDEATRARFRDEMENARRVASFCTAKVLDHGTFENRPYMVTEYISGTALAEHIVENGPLDSSTLHGFALGIAAALAAIHGAGLVHRDLKPANVLLSLSGPRVIDFGIARALNTHSNHTQTGIVMGSPGWMAPEQLLEETVTTKADIFAWGCLVAYAGTGSHPFGNGDAMTLGKRVLFAEPQLGALDSPLDRLVRAALSKESERRPKAQDLLLELAGGGGESNPNDPNALVSHALHQSWRPNLPPMPPGAPPMGGPMPGGPYAPAPYGAHPTGPPPPGPPPGMPANQSQAMQRPAPPVQPPPPGPPGPGQQGQPGQPVPAGHQAARNTGQFPVVPPNQTGPVPIVQPGQGQNGGHAHPGQPYIPPVPQQNKPVDPEKRRIRWLTAGAIVGSVLLLVFVILFTWLGMSGQIALPWQDDESAGAAQDDEQDAPPPEQEPEEEGAFPSRESDPWMTFTVAEAQCGLESHGVLSSENGSFCRFTVEVENISSDTTRLQHEWQSLETDNQEYPAERPATEDDDTLWEPLRPGDYGQGTIVFLIEDGQTPEHLVLRGNETSDGARIPVPDRVSETN